MVLLVNAHDGQEIITKVKDIHHDIYYYLTVEAVFGVCIFFLYSSKWNVKSFSSSFV